MERRLAPLLSCVLLSLSLGTAAGPVPAPPGDTAVYVYLQPLPVSADRLSFTLSAAAAVGEQGAEAPLDLAVGTVNAAEGRRQRLLAAGRVPAGAYARLSLRIAAAAVRREDGAAALLVPDAPVTIAVPFVAQRGGAVVLWLTLDGTGAADNAATFAPAFGARLAPRPLPSRAGFVSTPRTDTVTMFDKRLREVAAAVPTGAGPSGMALDQRRGRLYVACTGDDAIQAIDVTAAEVVDRARLMPGDGPREIALTPDGRTLLSANPGSNTVSVFDTDPLTRTERISVGNGPGSLAIDAAGRRAFVFNSLSNTISVIDIGTRRLAATISTDAAPLRGAFSPRGDRLYVIHDRSPYMTVLDPLQLAVVTRARLRIGLDTLAVDARRGLLYLGGRNDPVVELYDPNTLLPVGTLKTRSGTAHLAIDVEDNGLYVASPGTRSVVVAGLAERRMVSEFDVGEGVYWVSVMGER